MNIEGYRLVRHNHPSNVRRGSLCTYFRESVHVSLPQSLPQPYLNGVSFLKFVNNLIYYINNN